MGNIFRTRIIIKRFVQACVFASVLTALFVLNPTIASPFVGLGGYIGEKMLGDGTNQALYLGDGTHTDQILGSAPAVSTSTATNIGAGTATFNGLVSNLNSMPRADVWFEYGYSPLFIVHTTPTVTVNTTGAVSANVVGLTIGLRAYYRIVSSTDGTSRGSLVNFMSGGAQGQSYNLLRSVLLFIIAALIAVFIMSKTSGNWVLTIAGTVIGILAFKIVESIINTLF